MIVESMVDFRRLKHGRKQLCTVLEPRSEPEGRLPRLTRLMALAVRFEALLGAGLATNQAELARLGQVSRARISQIMNLLHLAPDIQEQILFLAPIERGCEPVRLAHVQPIAREWDWQKQRQQWQALLGRISPFGQVSGNCLELASHVR
jgi:hypothetical protein